MTSPSSMPQKITPPDTNSAEIVSEPLESAATDVSVSPRLKTTVSIGYEPKSHKSSVSINGRELTCPIDEVDIELNPDGSGRVILGIHADKITVKQANSDKPRRRR